LYRRALGPEFRDHVERRSDQGLEGSTAPGLPRLADALDVEAEW
jgi:hypothetical protein